MEKSIKRHDTKGLMNLAAVSVIGQASIECHATSGWTMRRFQLSTSRKKSSASGFASALLFLTGMP